MPLIEVKNFSKTSKFQEHVDAVSIQEIVHSWEGSTLFEIFINRYKYRLIQNVNYNPLTSLSGIEAEQMLNHYIFEVNRSSSSVGMNFGFRKFIKVENDFFKQEMILEIEKDQAKLILSYLDFINQNEKKLCRISNLSNQVLANTEKISAKIEANPKVALLRLNHYDNQTRDLFAKLDDIYELFQKSFKHDSEELVQQKENFPIFEWDYYKKPFQLEGYPEAQEEFLRAVIAWLREELYERMHTFYWTKTPNTYVIIEEYITELLQEIDQTKEEKLLLIQPIENKIIKEENYPKFIFASQKDYDFFCILTKRATTYIQLSFIYRQMSEIENPAMIVVKDKPFRDWFNKEPFDLKMHDTTNTYINAVSADRLWFYNTLKDLFFNES
jgi:hypothetical protein